MQEMRRFIESILRGRKLSCEKLAAQLGYKSKTSIERILNGESGPRALRKFELSMEREMRLTREERERLSDAVQISLLGYQDYLAEKEMWNCLRSDSDSEECARPLWIEDAETGAKQRLDERYAMAAELRITILNCSRVPVFGELRRLLAKGARVEHYICTDLDTAKTIGMISAILPVLYENEYMCYVLDETEHGSAHVSGLTRADMMVCQYTDEHNERREEAIAFASPELGRVMRGYPSARVFSRWLGIPYDTYQPMKSAFRDRLSLDEYRQFVVDCAALEAKRSIWKLKPDFGFEYIPSDIVEAAMREGPMKDMENFSDFLDDLRPIVAQRHANSITKRKPMFMVFKKNAMMQFALTGKTRDHFWGMRPFTPEERAKILYILFKLHQSNPYYHITFLKDDDLVNDDEIACFEGVGVLFVKPRTDYNLSAGHAEILITHREFSRLFLDFYKNTLIRKYVLSNAETTAFLERILLVCQSR